MDIDFTPRPGAPTPAQRPAEDPQDESARAHDLRPWHRPVTRQISIKRTMFSNGSLNDLANTGSATTP